MLRRERILQLTVDNQSFHELWFLYVDVLLNIW